MDQEALLGLARKHLIRYASAFAPFVVSRAEGSWIWDQDGNKYLDFTSGQICSTIGHNHPRITQAIREACDRVLHLNSWMLSEEVIRQARALDEPRPGHGRQRLAPRPISDRIPGRNRLRPRNNRQRNDQPMRGCLRRTAEACQSQGAQVFGMARR
jgi:Aminotransferase class-III